MVEHQLPKLDRRVRFPSSASKIDKRFKVPVVCWTTESMNHLKWPAEAVRGLIMGWEINPAPFFCVVELRCGQTGSEKLGGRQKNIIMMKRIAHKVLNEYSNRR